MTCEELIKHLKRAIEIEEEGLKKLQTFIKKTNNYLSKLLLERLIKDKISHIDFFKKTYDELKTDGTLDEVTVCQKFDLLENVDVFDYKEDEEQKISNNYIHALIFATEIEEISYNFYNELFIKSSDTATKEVFKKMKEHMNESCQRLNEELEYAKNAPST